MIDNATLTDTLADYKKRSKRRFEDTLALLIALGYRREDLGENFLWETDPSLDEECLRILREMSEGYLEEARDFAEEVCNDALDYFDFDAAWETQSEGLLERFDMQGSHLRSLLEVWLALAFVNGLTQQALKVYVSRFIGNPYASPLWKGLPQGIVSWGRGYGVNIMEQLAVIGQNAIIGSVRYAEWVDAMAQGAEYYIRRRGSTYDCDVCGEMANKAYPIDVPFEVPHSRCMCYPEYHFGEE